ncbi:hypothetical protein L2Y96_12230 [Luteibacter aegosomaticola]|uniref:hypothetical protein n=1 Tax=Luteibacter aegosomaticola TaxID=2911538 RepID=UPI001FF9406C|nr:hypothetical protein [Luteibacter aegosomaticola]UPG88187.1 hypothetical protein L2Y96_12230 [Luteibacter aegosomaticola]
MKIGIRTPSLKKSLAALMAVKRMIPYSLAVNAPHGCGWLTNPRNAAYSRSYARTTVSLWPLLRALFR